MLLSQLFEGTFLKSLEQQFLKTRAYFEHSISKNIKHLHNTDPGSLPFLSFPIGPCLPSEYFTWTCLTVQSFGLFADYNLKSLYSVFSVHGCFSWNYGGPYHKKPVRFYMIETSFMKELKQFKNIWWRLFKLAVI